MKKRKITQIISALLLVVLCMSFLPGEATAYDGNGIPPVFLMEFDDGSDQIYISACYLADAQGRTYLVTVASSEELVDDGYDVRVASEGYVADATFISSYGELAFFDADDLDQIEPLMVGSEFTEELQVLLYDEGSDGELAAERETIWMSDEWEDCDGYYVAHDEEDPGVVYWGCPVLDEYGQYAVGMLAGTEGDEMAVICLGDAYLPSSASVGRVDVPDSTSPGTGTQSGSSQSGTQDGGDGKGNDLTWVWIVLLAAGVVAVFVYFQKKNAKQEQTGQQTYPAPVIPGDVPPVSQYGAREGTISLEPVDIPMPPPVASQAKWQIRGVGGSMDGKVFLLVSQLRLGRSPQCEVVFSLEEPGISGNHCLLRCEADSVILRDLDSTYGTFLSRNVRMEPQVDYHLKNGDTFRLSEEGPTFRLEALGSDVRELTPAVRSLNDDRVFRADIQGKMVFGRDQRSQVAFSMEEDAISTRHCILYREGETVFLMDCDSANGTYFDDGARLRPNVPYRVEKGTTFFLSARKYSFVICQI
ncbi:MAG: FHA domain-containing protein [Oscillospiraceae bacterium]|nr:FHA domain-containing protein [Oscillospiraceae bacterium]